MSHFTVLVVTESQEQVTTALQPFHEYECTGTEDEYVRFVESEETLEELQEEHQRHLKEYPDSTPEDLGQHLDDYHGYHMEDGKWGRRTNPNAKWDWWQVGGRWSGFFDLKPTGEGVVGEQSLLAMVQNGGPMDTGSKVDQAKKGDIDFDRMMSEAADSAAKKYDDAHQVISGRDFKTWEQVRESSESIDLARTAYSEQSVVKDFREKYDNPFSRVDEFAVDREAYIRSRSLSAICPFAVLHGGEWKEKGKMGWWACVSDENENWEGDFLDVLAGIPDEMYLTVVDCHI